MRDLAIRGGFEHLYDPYTIHVWDFSEAYQVDDYGSLKGEIRRSKRSYPGLLAGAREVVGSAISITAKHSAFLACGYSAFLCDNGNGHSQWQRDVYNDELPWDNAMTEKQKNRIASLGIDSPSYNFSSSMIKVVSAEPLSIHLNHPVSQYFDNVWGLREPGDIEKIISISLAALNSVVAMDNDGYMALYCKKGSYPRTIFEDLRLGLGSSQQM